MVKQAAWSKNNRRELRRTMGRFLSIAAIVALGVSMFVGLRSARPAMIKTCNSYLAKTGFYDLQLLTSVGFDADAPEAYRALEGVTAAEGGFSADLLAQVEDEELVFKTHMLQSSINQACLTAGRMPEAADEVLADDQLFSEEQLGAVLTVEHQEDSVFTQDRYTVVGLCSSPLYLNLSRGTTSLGRGSVAGFLFLTPEGYDADYWTELYLRVDSGVSDRFDPAYADALEQWEEPLLAQLEAQAEARVDGFYLDARRELDDGWQEYYDGLIEFEKGKAEAEAQLEDAWAQLEEAKAGLDEGRSALADGEAQLETLRTDPYSVPELAAAKAQLDEARREFEDGEAQYQQGVEQYQSMKMPMTLLLSKAEDALSQAETALSQAQAAYDQAYALWEQTDAAITQQQEALYAPVSQAEQELLAAQEALRQAEAELARLEAAGASEAELLPARLAVEAARAELTLRQAAYDAAKAAYDAQAAALQQQREAAKEALDEAKAQLDQAQSTVDELTATVEDARKQLKDSELQLLEAGQQLEEGRRQLEDGEAQLQQGIADAIAAAEAGLAEGKASLEDGTAQYEEGVAEYERGRQELQEELDEADKELRKGLRSLQEAELELERMLEPSCYVMTPSGNNGFASFDNDTSIVAAVANVFPLFFLLVAALVCSSTMSRMVEEQRTQNGTLKALGYSDGRIMSRYASYAGLAALAGTAVGLILGTYLFPAVIWIGYGMLYHFSSLQYLFVLGDAVISVCAALLCCCGAACLAAWSDLRLMPAQLMRPKAPKAGKRIVLERIAPLWRRLSFLSKVSLRNIFRYRKRLIMMLLGTGGCLALLLTGLGLRDSIANVADDQFDTITMYDYAVSFSEALTPQEEADFRAAFEDRLELCAFAGAQTLEVPTRAGVKSVTFVATSDPAMEEILGLRWKGQELSYPTGDGLYISHALAEDAGLSCGDTLTVQLESRDLIEIPITGIFVNYVGHYAFLTEEGYARWFGIEPECKTVFATTGGDVYEVGAALQSYEDVINVTVVQDTKDMVANAIGSLDAIVALVVVCAAALSFVVGYNLININITERAREIATLKVLGFYQKETHDYVFRETILLTLMGTVVGIPLGIWLHSYIMGVIKVDFVCFQVQISPLSYALGIAVTLLVTAIVDRMLSKKIDAIDMAESLKSVE